MGTTGIGPILKPHGVLVESDTCDGMTLAIDAYNLLYSYHATMRTADGSPFTNSHGRITGHLMGILRRHKMFQDHDITPVYVFDNPETHPLKAKETQARYERRQAAQEVLDSGRDLSFEERRKLLLQAMTLDATMVQDAYQVLDWLGARVLVAGSDGEAEAAHLTQQGTCNLVASQDYDALLFGAKGLIRDLGVAKTPQLLTQLSLREATALDLDAILDAAILTGTDFNEGIRGIGFKTAIQLIQEHGSIEGIIDAAGPKSGKRLQAVANHDWLTETPLARIRSHFQNPPLSGEEPTPERPISEEFWTDLEDLYELKPSDYRYEQGRIEEAWF